MLPHSHSEGLAKAHSAHRLLEGVTDATHVMLACLDPECNFLWVNRAYAEAGGRSPEDYIGENHFALYPHEENEAIFRRVAQTGQPYLARAKPFEHPDQLDGGTTYWDWRLEPLRDASGNVEWLLLAITDVTNAEQTRKGLKDSEAQLHAIVESTPFLMVLLDEEARVRRINRVGAEFAGLAQEEVLGLPAGQALHCSNSLDDPKGCGFGPECRHCALRHSVRDTMEWGRSHTQLDVNMVVRVGEKEERKDFSLHSAPLEQSGERLTLLILEDVTSRKRAEEALKWVGRRNALLSRAAYRLLQSEDPRRVIEDLCREVMELIGCQVFFNYLVDEGAGKLRLNACAGIAEPEARKIEWLDYGAAVCGCVARDRVGLVAEDVQNVPDPRTDLVRAYGVQAYCCHPLMVGSRLVGTLSFGTRSRPTFTAEQGDVIKAVADLVAMAMHRVETEAALRESRTRLKVAEAVEAERQRLYAVLETMPTYVVLLTEDYHVRFANRTFEERFCKSDGRRCYEYLFHRNEPCENCETMVVFKTGAPHRWLWEGPDGREYDIYDFPFTDADGSRLVMELGIDVTERNRAERALQNRTLQLRALAIQLSQAEQRERKRLAGVLHDNIQQLIVAAQMQAAMLQNEGGDVACSRAAARKVESILEEALQESRSLTVDISPPALHGAGLIGGLDWLATRMAENHRFAVRLRTDPKAQPAQEETGFLLFECARELLFNAFKHANVREAEVTLARVKGGEIQLTVRDKGKGFDPDEVKNRPYGEPSFGLFSIQERIEHFGGSMAIESTPGRGTQVTLTVAGAETETPAEEAGEAAKGEPLAEGMKLDRPEGLCRVLIVDDHAIMREGLALLLKNEPGIVVAGEASDGPQAVELAKALAPDVVVMDVNLGEMGGIEATRRILADSPIVKVIGLSMHNDRSVAERMLEAGAAAYLNKGEASEKLVEGIRSSFKG